MTFGNGTFVAVGSRAVMTSTNGVDWTERTAAGPGYWRSVTYGNGLFVAVGNLAQTCGFMPWDPCVPDVGAIQIMTSPDGVTWTARTAPEANSWLSVTYGNGVFVAVTENGTNRVMTSPDGVTWTARAGSVSKTWQSVAFGNGTFVAASVNNIPIGLMTSTDGVNWTTQSGVANTNFLGFGNGNFVALKGDWGSGLLTSPDGSTWTPRSAANGNSWKSAVYGDGLWVAVASNGTNRVMTSPDAITWTARSAAEANSWSSVTYGNGLFVAVASNGTNRVMTSGVYVPPISAPDAPTSLAATPGDGSVSVSFTAGADGGAAISNYEYQLNGAGSWVALSPADASSPVTIPGLTNGAAYTVKLRAVNSAGSGAASDASDSFTPRTVPSAPSITSVTAGDSTVSVAFTAGSTGGSVITDYEYQLNGSGSWFSLGTTSSPASIGLTNGVTYTVKLRAVNVAGSGAASDASGSFTPATTPDAPTSLTATPGDGSGSISFTAGADGGASISKYEFSTDGGSTWADAVGTASPVTVNGLTNYTSYNILLRAVNSAGAGVASSAVSVTPADAGPSSCSMWGLGKYSIQTCWNPLVPAQGKVNRYRAYVYIAGTTTKVASCKAGAADTGCVVKGGGKLTAATDYDVEVRARVELAPHQVFWSLYSAPVRVSTLP